MDLARSWEITEGHLRRARSLLPQITPSADAEYESFLSHNELECAMRVLEDVAFDMSGIADFWMALADAAQNMQLNSDADEFRGLAAAEPS
jgi:hypothetical protein